MDNREKYGLFREKTGGLHLIFRLSTGKSCVFMTIFLQIGMGYPQYTPYLSQIKAISRIDSHSLCKTGKSYPQSRKNSCGQPLFIHIPVDNRYCINGWNRNKKGRRRFSSAPRAGRVSRRSQGKCAPGFCCRTRPRTDPRILRTSAARRRRGVPSAPRRG